MTTHDSGIGEMTRKARYFVSQQRIMEKINGLLDANNREFRVVSGTKEKPSRWRKSQEPKDSRKWQRQLPLAGSGAVIIQERGHLATKVKVILSGSDTADQIVFKSANGERTDIFLMGHWVWALQEEYNAQAHRNLNPEILEYENTFMPLWDWPGVNDPHETFDPYHKFMLDHPPPE